MIYVLCGGKNKDSNLNIIEKKAFSLLNKDKYNILFTPLAKINDKEKQINKFKELIKDINSDIKILDLSNLCEFDSLLNWCDIFYVSGGVSDDLVNIFKDNKLDLILKKYDKSNKIYFGNSAGAMLVTKESFGDKYMFYDNFHNYNYKMVNCLNILNISICPHYQNEDLIIYNDYVNKLDILSFGIEENTALVIDNNKYFVFKDYKNRSVYLFDRNHKMIPLYEGIIYEENSDFRS